MVQATDSEMAAELAALKAENIALKAAAAATGTTGGTVPAEWDMMLVAVYFVCGAVGVTQLPIMVDILDNLFPTLKIGRVSKYEHLFFFFSPTRIPPSGSCSF
jgi:hypothetical protein